MTVTTAVKAPNTARRASKQRPLWSLLRRKSAPYAFILPFIIVFAAFSVYPLIFTFRLSFTNWHGTGVPEAIGWGNYTYLLSNSDFWGSLGNAGVLWLLIIPTQVVLGMLAAVLLNNAKLRARGFFRTAFIVPFVAPIVAIAQIWIVVFDQNYGAVNGFLHFFGIPNIGWLTTTVWSKPTIALLFLWKTTGFAIIIFLSGLQSIDRTVYEAAEIDGATPARQLWNITVPLMRRTLMFLVVLQTLAVFQMFAEPYVVTKGGPYGSTTTAGLYLYNHITVADLGTGAANSFLLVIIVMGLSLVFVRLLRAKD